MGLSDSATTLLRRSGAVLAYRPADRSGAILLSGLRSLTDQLPAAGKGCRWVGAPRRPLNYCDYGQRHLGSEVRGEEHSSKCSGAENADGGDESGHWDVPCIAGGRLIPDCFRIASCGSQNGFFHDRVMGCSLKGSEKLAARLGVGQVCAPSHQIESKGPR